MQHEALRRRYGTATHSGGPGSAAHHFRAALRPGHIHQFIVMVEKSTNQLFGCTKFLIFGVIARGPTSCATHRNAASSTERSCSAASALSRSLGSNAWRAAATSLSNSGSLM